LPSDVTYPYGVAADASGNVYIASPGFNRLLKLVAGAGDFGPVNVGSTSLLVSLIFTLDEGGTLGRPAVLTQGVTGLDFADAGSGSCGTQASGFVYSAGDTCTIDVIFRPQFSGTRYGAAVLQDASGNALASGYFYGTGVGPQASFPPGTRVPIDSGQAHPAGVAVDAGGSVFFAESGAGAVYKETLSGGAYLRTPMAGGLNDPTGVAVDGRGNVYVAAASVVYKETLRNGGYSQSEIVTDLNHLLGIAVDGGGNVYIVSSAGGDVHKATLEADGNYTETAIGSGISGPTGVAVDGSGNIYITDARQGDLYKETLQGNGTYLQSVVAGGLAGPEGIALGAGGNVYISGSTSGEVYREALQANGDYIQSIAVSGLTAPWGIAVDARGNLYLSQDTPTGDLTRIDVADPPSLSFAQTTVGSASFDSPQTVTVSNIGNAALTFPVPDSSTNPSIAASFALSGATTCPEVSSSGTAGSLEAGSSCVYAVDFIPAAPGSISGSLVMTDTNLKTAWPNYAKQSIALSGIGITSDATRTAMPVAPNPVAPGLGATITATLKNTATAASVPNHSVTLADSVDGMMVSLDGGLPAPFSNERPVLNPVPAQPALSCENVKTLGAKGDGSTDDTAAIQSAINQAQISRTYTVCLPPGQYVINHQLVAAAGSLSGSYLTIVGSSSIWAKE
jgi:sugar lactone lactonase YvrE